MLALIAGTGALPEAVRRAHGGPVLVCGLAHCPPDVLVPDRVFCLEELGGVLHWLRRKGVRDVCMCGAITRPPLNIRRVTLRTWPLVPKVVRALRRGDDGALRIAVRIFENAGFRVLAAHEAAPELLPQAGVWGALPEGAAAAAQQGDAVSAAQGRADLGQASVVTPEGVVAREDEAGTDAMLHGLGAQARGAVLYKAPKPGQDRRVDLPVIGTRTARAAGAAGLSGIIIEHGGVMVLDQAELRKLLEDHGLFLWIRERGA